MGYVRSLGRIYAKAEEVAEMMPVDPNFQLAALQMHKRLKTREAKLNAISAAAAASIIMAQEENTVEMV